MSLASLRRLAASPLLCALTLLLGCSNKDPGGTLVLESGETGQVSQVNFTNAYITQSASGEYEVILVDNTEPRVPKFKKNRPLQPVALSPLHQVLHIHLYWKPLAGIRKNPAAINASIEWFVLGDQSDDILVYEGAGFVILSGGQVRSVRIRDGTLRPSLNRGQMNDPIGPARIRGEFHARINDSRVRETLAEVRRQRDAASSSAAAQ